MFLLSPSINGAECVWWWTEGTLISAADLQSAEFLSTGDTLTPTHCTETLRNQDWSRTQDTEVQWMWCIRCGGGSVCQRRHCRRTESQQDSPHTLLLCERQRTKRRLTLFSYCGWQSNYDQSRSDSRTDCSFQTHSHNCFLSFWFLCNSLI